jgi:hypothetical protein
MFDPLGPTKVEDDRESVMRVTPALERSSPRAEAAVASTSSTVEKQRLLIPKLLVRIGIFPNTCHRTNLRIDVDAAGFAD